MARQNINPDPETHFHARSKINNNFTELYSDITTLSSDMTILDDDLTTLTDVVSALEIDVSLISENLSSFQLKPIEGEFIDGDKTKLDAITGTNTGDQDVRVRLEGGGLVAQGSTNPTNGGVNSGMESFIGGVANGGNSGIGSVIFGSGNHGNSGNFCVIGGSDNFVNSGNNCTISGNYNPYNSGDYCSIGGSGNLNNSGDFCTISGNYNPYNSGDHCSIGGSGNLNNSGDFCAIGGEGVVNNTLDYARIHGSGANAQIIDLVAKIQTTDATPKTLTLGGAAETSTNRINIPENTAWAFTVTIVAKDYTSAKIQMWVRQGLIYNDGGTTTLDGVTGIGADRDVGSLGATITITGDDANDALKIVGTGVAANTIDWSARIDITQVR
jgi:hypothetical protein